MYLPGAAQNFPGPCRGQPEDQPVIDKWLVAIVHVKNAKPTSMSGSSGASDITVTVEPGRKHVNSRAALAACVTRSFSHSVSH